MVDGQIVRELGVVYIRTHRETILLIDLSKLSNRCGILQ